MRSSKPALDHTVATATSYNVASPHGDVMLVYIVHARFFLIIGV